MKTKIELEQDIINMTVTINNEYPELSKYILEIPVTDSEKEDVNITNLENYYNSLEEILSKYGNTHSKKCK